MFSAVSRHFVGGLIIPVYSGINAIFSSIGVNLPWRSNLQTVIVDCNLNIAVVKIAAMHRRIDDLNAAAR